MTKGSSTQHYLNIADIRDDTLILKNGEFRQILEVTALNFALKSEQEQATIVYQYQAFLNSLQFPIQILVQSRQLDLSRYLSGLDERARQTSSPLLQAQIADYTEFVSRLVVLGNIMEKHFYVVIPVTLATVRGRNIIAQFLKREVVAISDEQLAKAKTTLSERVSLIQAGLGGIGLAIRRLTNEEILKLLYLSFNPPETGEVAVQPQAT